MSSTTPTLETAPGYDVAIVGGGPAGLSAALTLGRARRRVLLIDAGAPRNTRAHEMHNFVTRDGIPPAEFRRIAHEQLAVYPTVHRSGEAVVALTGEPDDFRLTLADGTTVSARRVLLALGMVDVLPAMPGYRELWGRSLFQCPFCHGYEERDKPLGFLATELDKAVFALFLQNWSADVVLFTDGLAVPAELRERFDGAGVRIEERPIRGLVSTTSADTPDNRLVAVELEDGARIPRSVLFVKPPQRQTALVESLGLTLDPNGFVQVDARQATSRPGLFAAGDMTTPMQTAAGAAAAGQMAAAMLSHELTFGAPALAHR